MDGDATGKWRSTIRGLIVGIKSAHFEGPEWNPYEQAVIAGTLAHIPVMIDYGANRKERPLYELLWRVLRPGDIYTHCIPDCGASRCHERQSQRGDDSRPKTGYLSMSGTAAEASTGRSWFPSCRAASCLTPFLPHSH